MTTLCKKKADVWRLYKSNEECNGHTENVLVIAQAVGKLSDIRQAAGAVAMHLKAGCITPQVEEICSDIRSRLWQKFQSLYQPKTEH